MKNLSAFCKRARNCRPHGRGFCPPPPPEKRECELVYHGKEPEEDILADTLTVPLQPVRTFGDNGVGWHNMLIFGDNLQGLCCNFGQRRLVG